MNQRDKLIIKYAEDLKNRFDEVADLPLLKNITIGCGPSIYNRDSGTISSSEESEFERVKTNYLIRKLKLDPEENDLDTPLQMILEKYGRTHRTKYRVVVYYLLVKHYGKEDIY